MKELIHITISIFSWYKYYRSVNLPFFRLIGVIGVLFRLGNSKRLSKAGIAEKLGSVDVLKNQGNVT